VEETISKRVNFQPHHSINGLNGRNHVMPLQYLMEDDTIKEPPKSEAETYTACPYIPSKSIHDSASTLQEFWLPLNHPKGELTQDSTNFQWSGCAGKYWTVIFV
jgi:hypothetical protein